MNQAFSKFKRILGNGVLMLFSVVLVFLLIHLHYYTIVEKPVKEDRKAHVVSSVYRYFATYSLSIVGYYDILIDFINKEPQNILQCEDSLYFHCKQLCDNMENVVGAMVDLRPGYLPGHPGEFIPSYCNGKFVNQALLPYDQRMFPGRVIDDNTWKSGSIMYLTGPVYSHVLGCNILQINLPCFDRQGTYAVLSVSVNLDEENKYFERNNPYKGGKTYAINSEDKFIFNPEAGNDVSAYDWLVNKYGMVLADLLEKTIADGKPHYTDFTKDSQFYFAFKDNDNETIYVYTIPSKLLIGDISEVCRSIILIALAGALIIVLICVLNIFFVSRIRARESAIQKDVETASKIQKSMLEDRSRSCDSYDIDAVLIPARHIGGDLYCYIRLGDCLYFCVGDVAGKGITAAMHMSKCISLFRNIIRNCQTAREITSQLNNEMCVNNSECIFVTFFVGVLDLNTGRVDYCNAGHERPLYWSGISGEKPYYVELVSENIALGVIEDFNFVSGEFTMQKGSMLVQYTDGVDETSNEHGELFGKDRFREIFCDSLSDNVRDVNDSILNGLRFYAGKGEQNDDITLLAIKYKSGI